MSCGCGGKGARLPLEVQLKLACYEQARQVATTWPAGKADGRSGRDVMAEARALFAWTSAGVDFTERQPPDAKPTPPFETLEDLVRAAGVATEPPYFAEAREQADGRRRLLSRITRFARSDYTDDYISTEASVTRWLATGEIRAEE